MGPNFPYLQEIRGWARKESNLRPTDYESAALPLSYGPALTARVPQRQAQAGIQNRDPLVAWSRTIGCVRLLALILVALSIPFAAGCGSDEETDTTASAGGQTVEISGSDFKFDPADISVDQAGEVTFRLKNDGESPHAIEIEGNGVEEESDTIDPGKTTELTVDLEEGEYEIYCPVDGHKGLGMTGTVTVGAGGGGGSATTEDSDTGETETGDTDETETGETNAGGAGY
jgi:uncharacterized cupredoxin-like copper-binding protein